VHVRSGLDSDEKTAVTASGNRTPNCDRLRSTSVNTSNYLCCLIPDSLYTANTSRGVLPTVVRRCDDLETSRMKKPWPALGRSATGKIYNKIPPIGI